MRNELEHWILANLEHLLGVEAHDNPVGAAIRATRLGRKVSRAVQKAAGNLGGEVFKFTASTAWETAVKKVRDGHPAKAPDLFWETAHARLAGAVERFVAEVAAIHPAVAQVQIDTRTFTERLLAPLLHKLPQGLRIMPRTTPVSDSPAHPVTSELDSGSTE
jgi:hypothetical protein